MGVVTSIDYPGDYPNLVDFTYTITADEGMVGNIFYFFSTYAVDISIDQ